MDYVLLVISQSEYVCFLGKTEFLLISTLFNSYCLSLLLLLEIYLNTSDILTGLSMPFYHCLDHYCHIKPISEIL